MNFPPTNDEPGRSASVGTENEARANDVGLISGNDDPRRVYLRQWIAENEPALYTALRPIGGRLADTRGLSPADATSDILVEVTQIALTQAYPKYNLAYSSPRLWLLKIAHFIARRWREQAAIAASRRISPAHYAESEDGPWAEAPDPLESLRDSRGHDPARLAVGNLWLQQRLSLLSPQDRAIVESQVVYDLSFAETGARVGLTEGAARVRFHRIVKRLRQQEQDDLEMPVLREANVLVSDRGNGGANE